MRRQVCQPFEAISTIDLIWADCLQESEHTLGLDGTRSAARLAAGEIESRSKVGRFRCSQEHKGCPEKI
jgi:hypothetical protein